MTLALLALLTLAAILIIGAWRTDVHVGTLALAVTLLLGSWGADMSTSQITALFPSQLVLTVIGVSLFFGLASENGTLPRLTSWVLRYTGANARLLPVVFFTLAFLLSALGPGNIAAVAILAPVAMPAAVARGVSPLLMAIVLTTGANAGAFSPAAVTGSLNTALMHQIGLTQPGLPVAVFIRVALIQSLSAVLAYILFARLAAPAVTGTSTGQVDSARFSRRHQLTLVCFAAFLVLIFVFHVNAITAAFLLAALLTLSRAGNGEQAIRALPWSVILLVAGVGTLVNLLETVGSLDLATDLLARSASPASFHAVLAFLAGLASVGSSSSGVVMPLFVPLVPELLAKIGAGTAMSAVIAIDVGSHMVDVSPLSTLGALCLAALPEGVDKSKVFRGLLTWGLAMALLGALLAWVALDLN